MRWRRRSRTAKREEAEKAAVVKVAAATVEAARAAVATVGAARAAAGREAVLPGKTRSRASVIGL